MNHVRKLFVQKSNAGFIQMIRYGFVVVFAAPIDLGGYIILKSSFHIYYVLAATISFTLSLMVNYWLSVLWVWNRHSGLQKYVDTTIFAVIGFVGLVITDLVVYTTTTYIGFNYIISKLLAFVVVFFWSFGARRLLFEKDFSQHVVSLYDKRKSLPNNEV